MIFISEKRGRPVGSKNKKPMVRKRPMKRVGSKEDTPISDELSKEEQKMFNLLSTFAQKGYVDFTTASLDNEEIMKSGDQELISLYGELVSAHNDKSNYDQIKVFRKLYDTFSDGDTLSNAVDFNQYLRDQGYEFSTVDDADIPKDQVRKLQKDFESQRPKPEPENSTVQKRVYLTSSLHNFTALIKYLKDDLNLDDNEIKSRINTLLNSAGTDTPTLNEQILRDFKRFL